MKQDDYRNMCDEIKLSEEQKDKIWVAARAKVQTKKENRQKMGTKCDAVQTAKLT